MSIESTLVAAGAECVGGDLILKHKSLGRYRNGDFFPSLEGIALAEQLAEVKQAEILQIARESTSEDFEVDVSELVIEPPRRGRKAKE